LRHRLPVGKTQRVTSAPPPSKSTPELIREAAVRLFAHRGYEATTLQAVAEVVGISKQAILHHFRSKEELHAAVLAELVGHWQRTLPQLLLTAGATKVRFDAVFSELLAFFARDPDRARIVLRELLDRPEESRKLLKDVVGPWMEAIAAYIRVGQERGVHRAEVDVEAYLVQVLQIAMAGTATAEVTSVLLGEGTAGRERFAKELARIAQASLFTPRHANAEISARSTHKEGT
jgi:TetR/AcrR family transcriptional regulator